MPLSIGSRLGPYEILSAIGAGGMGEVYRARDPKLGRDVAIKVLPEAFARDAERMARFQREAKVLASLDHPNIATIHGLEESGGTRALVMQLVEGPTLADRIKAGPIPVDEAVRIARQIADALEYAHERGIIHRDLKPANVKVTNDDAVKVLDFGLAKALEGDPSSIDISTSPTISRMATQQGVLLGTAAYMSPEQAKAKPVDRRADIWAFGCVLYEMLAGKIAFPGESVTDTLAAVIRAEPDWSLIPSATPMRVRVLLQRCLQKDPKQRLRDIGDARISLDEILSGAQETTPVATEALTAPWRRALPWAVAGVLGAALAAVSFVHFREKPVAQAQLLRYEILPPEKTSFGTSLALSPDGRHLAFTATTQERRTQLWVRDLDSLVLRPLPGTEGASGPFWSPDSRLLGFEAGSKLETTDISGGVPEAICDIPTFYGGAWNRDGVILLGFFGGLMQVPAAGGTPSFLTKVNSSRGEVLHLDPWFLSDGRHFLYVRTPGTASGTYVGSLDSASKEPTSGPLLSAVARAVPGRVLFLQNGTLMAQAFDETRLELTGNPIPILQQVTDFTVSDNGLLAYFGGSAPIQLTLFNQQGKIVGTVEDPGINPEPAISADGGSLVVTRSAEGRDDLWLYNLTSGTRSRLTFDGKEKGYPVWSPDGSHVAFRSTRDGGNTSLYQKTINGVGQEEILDKTPGSFAVPLDWSSDGRYLIEGVLAGPKLSIWVLPLSKGQANGNQKSSPYLDEPFNEVGGKLSPNGEWLAYASDETGRYEVYVQTFPKRGGKWPVSINGGSRPNWSRDGKQLYFVAGDGKLMAVNVKSGSGGAFEAGAPEALFDPHMAGNQFTWFGVTKDGRFLFPTAAEQSGRPVTIVVNWPSLLKE